MVAIELPDRLFYFPFAKEVPGKPSVTITARPSFPLQSIQHSLARFPLLCWNYNGKAKPCASRRERFLVPSHRAPNPVSVESYSHMASCNPFWALSIE